MISIVFIIAQTEVWRFCFFPKK